MTRLPLLLGRGTCKPLHLWQTRGAVCLLNDVGEGAPLPLWLRLRLRL